VFAQRNQHRSQDRRATGEYQAIDGDDNGCAFEVLELGVFNLAIDLGQTLLAAHGQQGMSKGHQNAEEAKDWHEWGSSQEAQCVVTEMKIGRLRRRRQVNAWRKDY